MKRYGCIGKKLSHSFSKEVHARLADYKYELIELNEEEIKPFFEKRDFEAINVTLPYKETVIPYLDSVSEIAARIGAVNTVVNKNGKLYGYNTDYYGMKALIDKTEIDVSGKKVLILGTGGTSKTARAVASDMGAKEILTVSRSPRVNTVSYEEATSVHKDADIIINTTPVGMFPDTDKSPIDVSVFENLSGVIDAVYNPLSTKIVSEARKRAVKASSGLYMLVMQAVVAAEKFLDTKIDEEKADEVFKTILASKENVVLTGMPGSGKSTVGKLLKLSGFSFVDTDEAIEKRVGKSIKELISEKGEKYFRDTETEIIKEISSKTAQIIATGGGAILRKENVNALKRNGKIFFINADPERLVATDSRPLSDTKDKLLRLYDERIDLYKACADVIVPDLPKPSLIKDYILEKRTEQLL